MAPPPGSLEGDDDPPVGADARLLARNAELAAWAARANHDLRTPLAVISGMAQTLEAAWDRLAPDDRARMLASISSQAAKAMVMVDEAVALAGGGENRDEAGDATPPGSVGTTPAPSDT